MATSLAAQLKKLAVPETQNLLTGDFKQASFLFDDQEAAAFTKQHFYNIGVNGLQQLIAKDERFAEFEQNLFSQSSQSLQRYVQTSEVNQQLDLTINKFLLRLSSYMQFREAHKAMEWMVHRYNVHLRNVDTFMMCMLPYHDQQPFVMALQLLRMNSNEAAKWRWLESVKKGGTFLPRQTLVTHCKSAKGFLGFMCDMLRKHIEANTDEETGVPSARHLQQVLSFYTQIILGVVLSGPPSEDTVSTLLPVLTAGLKSVDLPDHMVSSYMVLSQLFMQTSLAQPLLQSLLNVIAKNMQPRLVRSAVTVIIIMFQKQDISKVPKKAFRYLVRQPSLAVVLRELSVGASTEPFLQPFLTALISQAAKEAASGGSNSATGESSNAEDDEDAPAPSLMSLLLELMSSIDLKRTIVMAVARILLKWFSEHFDEEAMDVDDSSFNDGPFRLFKLLENKYSSFLDATITELSGEEGVGKKVKLVTAQLFKVSVESAQRGLVSDPATSVTICLHHRQGVVRLKAVEALLQKTDLIADKTSIQPVLALRLHDDEPDVVRSLLQEPKNLWALFDDKTLLYSTLLKQVALKENNPLWKEVHTMMLQALCCVPPGIGSEDEVAAVVLSNLVVTSTEEGRLAVSLLQSPFASYNKLLSHVASSWLPLLKKQVEKSKFEDKAAQLLSELVDTSSAFFLDGSGQAHRQLNSLYDCLPQASRPARAGLLILSTICSAISKTNKTDLKGSLQRMLAFILSNMALKQHLFRKKDDKPEKESVMACNAACLAQLKETGTLPSWLIKQVVLQAAVVPVSSQLKELMFWNLSSDGSGREAVSAADLDWLNTVTSIVNLLLELQARGRKACSGVADECFASFFKVFSDKESVVKFLCMVWMSSSCDGVTPAHKARLLQFAQVYLASLSNAEKASLLSESLPFLPCIMILLSSQYESVRDVAFTLLALVSAPGQESSPLHWFTQNLLRFRQEVTKDNAFLTQVVKTLLEVEDSNTSPPSPKKRRRSASKQPPHSATLGWLLGVVCEETTPDNVKAGMLRVLHRLDTPESFLPLISTLKSLVISVSSQDQPASATTAVAKSLKSPQALSQNKREILELLLKRFTPVLAVVVEEESECLKALLLSLRCPVSLAAQSSGDTVQMITLEQLRSKFMSALPSPSRKIVVAELLTLASVSDSAEVVRRCRKVVKHMSLESSVVTEELKSVLAKSDVATVREAKRQKLQSTVQSQDSELETLPWKRVTLLLEMMQSKKKLTGAISVVPMAFQVLGRVLELESEGSGEYLKQLLLGLINFICSRCWNESGKDKANQVKGEQLNMDLIVQCIRSSDNAHTHHQALLLLSSAAKIAPSLLLHNMMSVFTFMGANILRQDDAYSFHVISNILENVIPALIMACEEKSKQKQGPKSKKTGTDPSAESASNMMTVVLRVFVDAIPHIPSHRRTILFEKLVTVVGSDQYLWRLLLLYIESMTSRGVVPAQRTKDEDAEVLAAEEEKTTFDLGFLTSLIERFSTSQLLSAFQESLTYVLSLPEQKATGAQLQKAKPTSDLADMSAEDMAIFNVVSHTPKQLRHFKFATLMALNHLVASQHMVAQLSMADPCAYLAGYQRLLETCLQWIGQVTSSLQHHTEDTGRRYWKLLLNKSHDLLETLVNLLPDSMFFEVVSGLMGHSLPLVQRRAMELLNTKLQQQKNEASTSSQVSMLMSMVGKLQTIVSDCLVKPGRSAASEEQLVNGQTALYSLKILCRMVGEAYHAEFLEVLKLGAKALTIHSENGMVSGSAMMCVAEVIAAAKTQAIEHLGLVMPLFVSQLKSDTIIQYDVLLLVTITSLQKVIEALPLFLSPYLQDIMVQVCIISSLVSSESESRKAAISQKVKHICTTLATATPTRTFIPVVQKSFLALEDRMSSCAESAMAMLKEHIGKMSREDLNIFSQDLLKFFFVCFDIRVTQTELTEEDLDIVEGCVIEAFVTLVFKLSEAQFKPMLLQIYNWASEDDVNPDRVLFFYRLCDSLAKKLKSLFTLFAGHILKHSAQILDACNNNKSKCRLFGKGKLARSKSCRLVCYVVDCLQKTFAHDTEGFTTKERFDIVMQPLVDQLENELGKPSVCETRAVSHVVPCIGSLAAAARDDSLWKDLNYQILLKTRHQNPKVRMWALAAVDAFHKQLGEDFTQLVPEAIPFMAELMEDESDEVEKYTQKVLAAMEVSVGENLQEYF